MAVAEPRRNPQLAIPEVQEQDCVGIVAQDFTKGGRSLKGTFSVPTTENSAIVNETPHKQPRYQTSRLATVSAFFSMKSISNTKYLFDGWCPLLADAGTCVQR